MKRIALILFLAPLAGCTTAPVAAPPVHDTVMVIPNDTPIPNNIASIRGSETVRTIYVNRFVDPSDSSIMHEAHELYKIDKSPNWNLRPNTPLQHQFGQQLTIAAPVEAEMNLQSQALADTNALVKQFGQQLISAKNEMLENTKQNKLLVDELKRQNAEFKEEVKKQQEKINSINQKLSEIELKTR